MINSYEDKEVNLLLSRCRERDDDAFSELLTRYSPMMKKLISSFTDDPTEQDELFSEASLTLHVASMRYDLNQDKVSFGLYARICIHNRLVDLHRAAENKPSIISDADVEQLDDGSSLESSIIARETVRDLLDNAKEELSDYEYRVLILHMQGYKTAAIAQRLSKNAKSVDNAKSRIFRRLREMLRSSE